MFNLLKLFSFKNKNPVYELKPRTCLDLIHKLRKDRILFLDIFGTFKIENDQVLFKQNKSYYDRISSDEAIQIMKRYLSFNEVQEIEAQEKMDYLIMDLNSKVRNL